MPMLADSLFGAVVLLAVRCNPVVPPLSSMIIGCGNHDTVEELAFVLQVHSREFSHTSRVLVSEIIESID